MRKFFCGLFITVLLQTTAIAQVHIQSTLQSVGMVQKNQLWNMVLVNGTNAVLNGRLELVLYDRQSAQELMTATTGNFTVPKGSLLVNSNLLNPVLYNYLGMEPDRSLNGLLPPGAYTACYSFVRNPDNKPEILAEECVVFDIEPLSPPLLLFPADSAVLDVQPAQFTWMPPTPAGMISNLRYEVVVTEILPGQQAAEAVAENVPHYSTAVAVNNFLSYPSANPSFEKNKWYAWQVVARDKNSYAGKSEVWVFSISKPVQSGAVLNGRPYIALRKEGADKAMLINGQVRFYYFNQLQEKETTVSVTDLTGGGKRGEVKIRVSLQPGENYIQKDLSRYIKLEEGHLYRLSLQNAANENWSILLVAQKEKK